VAEPPANASDRSPKTPPAKLADDHTATGPKHARDFSDGVVWLPEKTKHRHGDDAVERPIGEGKRLG
jgi:hypothetical protein